MLGGVRRFWKRARSAVTGRFIKKEEVEKDPERTVVEEVERKEKQDHEGKL